MRFPLYPFKLGLVVVLPTLAALFIGLFAVSRLDALADRAKALETARLPRADLASTVERRLLLAAQAIREYALSSERATLEHAKKELAQAADAVHAAQVAADRPGMAKLAAEAKKIAVFLDAYKKAAESSVAANERVATDRSVLSEAAEKFATTAAAYADWQAAQWNKALNVKYPQPSALRQHAQQLRGIQTAITAGRVPQLAAEKARSARNPDLLSEAVPQLDTAEKALRALKGGDENDKRLIPVFSALADYRQAISQLLDDWEALRATGRKILETERAALSAGSQLGGATLTEAAGDASSLATSLNRSRVWLVVASVFVALAGLSFAGLVAVFLGMPVRRCALFARDLSVGRLTDDLPDNGVDEVGLLAESLREMARRIGKHFAR